MKALISILFWLSLLTGYGQDAKSYERTNILTASSANHSRSTEWRPGEGIALEVSGMEWMNDGRLAVCLRKGEVWLLDGVLSGTAGEVKYHLFASGLHEPLGLLKDGKDLLVTQRGEVTRLSDGDGDGVADGYLTECDGWNVSGNYHAYAYGPQRDGKGDLWVTLNLGMGKLANNSIGWRGWGGIIGEDGQFVPKSFGMRSPCGLGANRAGDVFFSDQQGTWIPATPIYHLREGVFYGNQESVGTLKSEGSLFQMTMPKANQPYPAALKSSERFVPPAVWLPYNKMGRSATDIERIEGNGKFGPFDGQLLVGEFANAAINRVFLEKINGEYQGACFPFLDEFPSAVFRMRFAPDGSLMVGLTNRGWSSLGNRAYGLVRVRGTAEIPFAIREMRARPDGFELEFTKSLAREGIENAFAMSSFTYQYSSRYGGDEIETKGHKISAVELAKDGKTVRLQIDGLRPLYVHELRTNGLRSDEGDELTHPNTWYTLNAIPGE
ncbi:hypothetical protein N9A94_04810 [Akkermansiaceae bacterium]|nr:hypothetical protein [Akkermansiaceae bacterium]